MVLTVIGTFNLESGTLQKAIAGLNCSLSVAASMLIRVKGRQSPGINPVELHSAGSCGPAVGLPPRRSSQ